MIQKLPKCMKCEMTSDDGTAEHAHLKLIEGEDETGHYSGVSSAGNSIDVFMCSGKAHTVSINGEQMSNSCVEETQPMKGTH